MHKTMHALHTRAGNTAAASQAAEAFNASRRICMGARCAWTVVTNHSLATH